MDEHGNQSFLENGIKAVFRITERDTESDNHSDGSFEDKVIETVSSAQNVERNICKNQMTFYVSSTMSKSQYRYASVLRLGYQADLTSVECRYISAFFELGGGEALVNVGTKNDSLLKPLAQTFEL